MSLFQREGQGFKSPIPLTLPMKKTTLLSIFLFFILLITASYFVFIKLYASVKKDITIALVGDSMIDTMQTDFPYLKDKLKQKYPNVNFKLLNYGVGAENAEMGLARLSKPLNYKDRTYIALTELKPDIIIVGTWAYNPFSPHDVAKHEQFLSKIVQTTKKTGANVYLLKEIAPLSAQFGRGVRGVNWEEGQARLQSKYILDQLGNADRVASREQVLEINTFELTSDNNSGKKEFVNESDGINPSPQGHQLMAQSIVDTMQLQKYNPFRAFFNQQLVLLSPEQSMARQVGEEVPGGTMYPTNSIFENIVQSNNLTTSASALRFTGLEKPLTSTGPYTIFLPNNTAFEKLPKEVVDTFFAPEQIENSKDRLSYHIVPGTYSLKDMESGVTLRTISGKLLNVRKKYNNTVVQDVGIVVDGDIRSRNGYIHIIDTAFIQGEGENIASSSAQ